MAPPHFAMQPSSTLAVDCKRELMSSSETFSQMMSHWPTGPCLRAVLRLCCCLLSPSHSISSSSVGVLSLSISISDSDMMATATSCSRGHDTARTMPGNQFCLQSPRRTRLAREPCIVTAQSQLQSSVWSLAPQRARYHLPEGEDLQSRESPRESDTSSSSSSNAAAAAPAAYAGGDGHLLGGSSACSAGLAKQRLVGFAHRDPPTHLCCLFRQDPELQDL